MLEGHERTLLAAQGYSELGMVEEALGEINSLPAELADHEKVVEMRTVILMQAKRWKTALTASRALCKVAPEKTSGFIHAAYCLHALGRTEEARDILLGGPEKLHAEPTFHYNLACYECTLGNLDLARLHLEKSFALNKDFREYAKNDPDLAALRE
jgi:predicted Zn-dependent protease